MSSSHPARAPARGPSAAANAAFLLALGLCAFTLLSLRIPIASEVRYIESAREMVETRDWVVPQLGYVPYFEKPILLYWLGAASQKLLGESGIAVRLPSILSALLSLLITWDLGRRLLGERGGLQAGLVILGSAYFLVLGSVLTTDTLFAACLWSAWYCWWRSLEARGGTWRWLYCLATALGFMTKGPLAWILVGGSIATFLVAREPWPAGESSLARGLALRVARGLRAALRLGLPLRLVLLTLVLNLPWSLLVLQRDPRFLEFFYVRENFKAFFNGNVHHTQNFAYYAGVLLQAFLPWSLPCAFALVLALRDRVRDAWQATAPAGLRTYLGAIVVFTLLFLQASSAKLASYPLPILPAIAILIVDCWQARLARPPAWMRWSLLAGALLSVVGGAVYLLGRGETVAGVPAELREHLSVVLHMCALALLVGGVLALRGRFWAGIALSGAALACLVISATSRLEELGLGRNVQPLARLIADRQRPGDLVVTTSQFVQDYTLQLTLHQRIGLVGNARELGMGFFAEVTSPQTPIPAEPYGVRAENLPANPQLFTRERVVEILRSEKRAWFIGSIKEVDALLAEGLPIHVIDTVGDARLCTNAE